MHKYPEVSLINFMPGILIKKIWSPLVNEIHQGKQSVFMQREILTFWFYKTRLTSEKSKWKINAEEGMCVVKEFCDWLNYWTTCSFLPPSLHHLFEWENLRLRIHMKKYLLEHWQKQASLNGACCDGRDTVRNLQWYLRPGSMALPGSVPRMCRLEALLAMCHVFILMECVAPMGCSKTSKRWLSFHGMMLASYNYLFVTTVINVIASWRSVASTKFILNVVDLAFWW